MGLAMGGAEAVWMAGLAWAADRFHVAEDLVHLTSRIYPGYEPSFKGGFVGAAWGMVAGFVFGWIMASLYNAIEGVPAGIAAERPSPIGMR